MSLTYNDYLTTVKSQVATRKVKIEILDSNENVINTITPNLLDGSVQKLGEYSRRNATITLENSDGTLIPSVDSYWVNSKYKLYTGYEINGEEYYISQGIFLIGEPELSGKLSNLTLTLNLYDKMEGLSGLLGGTLSEPYNIAVGSSVEDVITQIFSEAGEIKPPIIQPTSEVTPYSISQPAGSTYLDLIKILCEMITYVCFYDENGYPVFCSPTDVENDPSVFDFTTSEVNYLGANRRYTYPDIKNYVVVYGDNINGSLYKAVAQDTSLTSPTSVAQIGKKALVIEDSNISSTALCQDRANFELQKATALIETVNLNAIIVDHLEAENIITITDSSLGLNQDRYLIKSLNIPLVNSGEMTAQLWKSRSLS